VESDSVPPAVASVAALSPDVPTSSVQSDQPAGPPGGEVPWVSELLSDFSEVFQGPLPAGLPPERSEGHSIPTKPGHSPPFRSMYHLSPLKYRELEKQVTKFLKDGILEVSQSPYRAPVLFVPKTNGRGLRLCVDYRALNSITVKCRALRGYCRSSSGPAKRSLRHGRSSPKFRLPDPCPPACPSHAICLLAMRNERARRRRLNWPIYLKWC
jgi:hypothetical protein